MKRIFALRTGLAFPVVLAVLSALLAAAASVGCGKHNTVGVANTLRYPIIQEPGTFDPARLQDIYTTELLQNVYEGMVTFDANNQPVPAAASSWDISQDRRTYTFHLRPGLRFQSPYNREVTADDVKYTIERALNPATRSSIALNYLGAIVGAADVAAGRKSIVSGVRVVDPHTIAITIDKPRGYFLSDIAFSPAWLVCREAVAKSGAQIDAQHAIGCGPFAIESYQSGSKVVLRANPDYHGGAPALKRIERPVVVDHQTMHAMYESGEVDSILPAMSDLVPDQRNPALRDEAKLLPEANTYYIVMHPGLQPVFKDLRVRRAIAMAIDRAEVNKLAFLGTAIPSGGILPPGMPGYSSANNGVEYKPGLAAKLLAEAGYPNGMGFPSLTLNYVEKQDELAASAGVIRNFLQRNLGITINLREYEAVSFWHDTSDEEKVPFFITGWIADYPDPQDFLSTLFRTGAKLNHVAYSNPRFDALCDRADGEANMTVRAPLYQQADQIEADDVACIPLVYYRQPMLIKPYVKEYQANLLNFFLPHWRTRIVK